MEWYLERGMELKKAVMIKQIIGIKEQTERDFNVTRKKEVLCHNLEVKKEVEFVCFNFETLSQFVILPLLPSYKVSHECLILFLTNISTAPLAPRYVFTFFFLACYYFQHVTTRFKKSTAYL